MVLEVTRRCNMTCAHCLRGDWKDLNTEEPLNISPAVLDALFSKVGHISSLALTGGEPLLDHKLLSLIVSKLKEHEVSVGCFYIRTNGSVCSSEVLQALAALYFMAEEKDCCAVEVSQDNHHDDVKNTKAYQLLQCLKFVRDAEFRKDSGMLTQGNAEWNGIGPCDRYPTPASYVIEDDCVTEGEFYVTVSGDVIGGCDFSYDNMDEYFVCTVFDAAETILTSCEDF